MVYDAYRVWNCGIWLKTHVNSETYAAWDAYAVNVNYALRFGLFQTKWPSRPVKLDRKRNTTALGPRNVSTLVENAITDSPLGWPQFSPIDRVQPTEESGALHQIWNFAKYLALIKAICAPIISRLVCYITLFGIISCMNGNWARGT